MLFSMATNIKQSFSDTDKKHLRELLSVLDMFTTKRATMPIQYIRMFLLVALEEGLSVNELSKRSGLAQSVTSRHLLDIGEATSRIDGEGFNWVEHRENPENLKQRQITLTDEGKGFLQKVIRMMWSQK